MIIDTLLGQFHVYASGTITRALQEGQWWDDHLKPILDEAPAGGWAIDIGAHFGWFTRYLSHRHAVIAVEPWPASFELLLRNVQVDQPCAARVACWPLAAYDRVSVLRFARDNDRTDAGAFGFTPTGYSKLTATDLVPAVPLDLYLPTDVPVTVIKCDAQGADLRALVGLSQTIARCRPLIVFEWEEGMAAWQGDCWADYCAFFEGLNYSVERITTDYWDFCARPC